MGWGHGVNNRGEDVGYAVEDTCHDGSCAAVIDRGLYHCCGGLEGEAFGGDGQGCGRYFCGAHLFGSSLCTDCQAAEEKRIANETTPERIQRLMAEWAQEPPNDEGCTPGGWAKSPI